jgi:hypothetical protein
MVEQKAGNIVSLLAGFTVKQLATGDKRYVIYRLYNLSKAMKLLLCKEKKNSELTL